MSMRGLYKSTGYWQTQAARSDWTTIAAYATSHGGSEYVQEFQPKPEYGYRKIDKCICELRTAMAGIGVKLPPCPSNTDEYEKWRLTNE